MNDKTQRIFGTERLYDRAMKLLTGDGCKTNPPKAFHLFRVCAKAGHSQSQYSLGMFFKKWGENQDFQEAAVWLKRAAIQGHPEAQFKLAGMYKTGEGARRNRVLALKWFLLASHNGDEDAEIQCNLVGSELTAEQEKRALVMALRFKLKAEMNRTIQELMSEQGVSPPSEADEDEQDDLPSIVKFPTSPQ